MLNWFFTVALFAISWWSPYLTQLILGFCNMLLWCFYVFICWNWSALNHGIYFLFNMLILTRSSYFCVWLLFFRFLFYFLQCFLVFGVHWRRCSSALDLPLDCTKANSLETQSLLTCCQQVLKWWWKAVIIKLAVSIALISYILVNIQFVVDNCFDPLSRHYFRVIA